MFGLLLGAQIFALFHTQWGQNLVLTIVMLVGVFFLSGLALPRQQQRQQRVGGNGKPHPQHKRQGAQQRQHTGTPKGKAVAAQHLPKAGKPFFAGGVFRHAGTGFVKMKVEQRHFCHSC